MDIVAELEIDRLRVENEKLKSEIKKLKKEKANSSWQYEMDHKDDWRTVHEMGSL
jgi:hypothetical protein